MQICIRRGANTIGGSAVELTANTGERIIIDLGQPLDAEKCTPDLLPDIPGLVTKTDDLLGILISHPHQDHYALCAHIDKNIPIYMGADTMNIMNAMVGFGIGTPILFLSPDIKITNEIQTKTFQRHMDANKPTFKNVHPFNTHHTETERKSLDIAPFFIGPFKIKPYLMDHSAYDAYAFLIECDGKSVLYSGDFRAHGRKHRAFDYFIKNAPTDVDVLLMEGSCLGRNSCQEYEKETSLEQKFFDVFQSTDGLCMVLASSQNIDRIVSIYKGCQSNFDGVHANRELAISSYTGCVLMCTGNGRIPHFGQTFKIKRLDKEHGASHWITADDIAKNPGKYVVFLTHRLLEMLKTHEDILINENARLVYSMWDGYKDKDGTREKLAYFKSRGVKIIDIHTSGHADVPTLQKFATAVGARRLVPIHTFYPDEFNRLFENVEPHANNKPFNV